MRHHPRHTIACPALPGSPLRRLVLGTTILACVLGLVIFAPRGQAAVGLLYVRAISQAGGPILVQWATASELDTVGFRIYRGPAASGPFDHLVCAEGAQGGQIDASYECLDSDVTLGVTYYYRLSEISASNTITPHPEFIAQATAGVLITPTATVTATPTATATATRTPTATVTATAKPTGLARQYLPIIIKRP